MGPMAWLRAASSDADQGVSELDQANREETDDFFAFVWCVFSA